MHRAEPKSHAINVHKQQIYFSEQIKWKHKIQHDKQIHFFSTKIASIAIITHLHSHPHIYIRTYTIFSLHSLGVFGCSTVVVSFSWRIWIILYRSHLREIRDRSVLRLFESNEVNAPQALPGGPGVPQPLPQSGSNWDQDQVFAKRLFFNS